jgi:plasmid stabilization system protein ParE
MTYHVITLPSAEEEIVDAAAWISQPTDIDTAAHWIAGLQTAMASLAQSPFAGH